MNLVKARRIWDRMKRKVPTKAANAAIRMKILKRSWDSGEKVRMFRHRNMKDPAAGAI